MPIQGMFLQRTKNLLPLFQKNFNSLYYTPASFFAAIRTPQEAFKILELSPNATEAEMKAQYIKMIKEHHPDKHNNSHESKKKTRKIIEAKEILDKYYKTKTNNKSYRSNNNYYSTSKNSSNSYSSQTNNSSNSNNYNTYNNSSNQNNSQYKQEKPKEETKKTYQNNSQYKKEGPKTKYTQQTKTDWGFKQEKKNKYNNSDYDSNKGNSFTTAFKDFYQRLDYSEKVKLFQFGTIITIGIISTIVWNNFSKQPVTSLEELDAALSSRMLQWTSPEDRSEYFKRKLNDPAIANNEELKTKLKRLYDMSIILKKKAAKPNEGQYLSKNDMLKIMNG